jgi:hypothetical protein
VTNYDRNHCRAALLGIFIANARRSGQAISTQQLAQLLESKVETRLQDFDRFAVSRLAIGPAILDHACSMAAQCAEVSSKDLARATGIITRNTTFGKQ